MKKKIGAIVFLIIAIYVSGLFYIQYKAEQILSLNAHLDYQELKIDYKANLEIAGITYDSKKLKLSDLNANINPAYLSLINGDKLILDNLELSNATLEIFEVKKDSIANKENTETDFLIHNLKLKNIKIAVEKNDKTIEIRSLNALLKNIDQTDYFDLNTIQSLNFYDLVYPVDELHKIQLSEFLFEKSHSKIKQFRLVPLYEKDNYSNHVKIETDLMDLSIPYLEVELDGFVFKDKKIQKLHLDKVIVDSAFLEIYRDKTLRDDTSIKPSYSKRLKDLKVEFGLNHLTVNSSRIRYGEKYGSHKDYAIVDFNDIDLTLDSLNNYLEKNYTKLKSNFKLNNESELNFFMTYGLHSEFESFDAKLESVNVKAVAFSELLRQSINKGISGEINKLSADFQARNNIAFGSFDLSASNVKIKLYNKNQEKDKILSFLANKLIKKEIDKSFEIKDIEKDQTKSFWNYIWTFIKTGLKRSLL